MAMKLSEVFAQIESLITFTGMPEVVMEDNRIHFSVSASHTYKDGGQQTEHGDVSFTIFCNNEGGFDPDSVHFESSGEHHTKDLEWRWDGKKFDLVTEEEAAASPTANA